MATVITSSFLQANGKVLSGPSAAIPDPATPKQVGDVFTPTDGFPAICWNSGFWTGGSVAKSFFYIATFDASQPQNAYLLNNGTLSPTPTLQPIGNPGILSNLFGFIRSNNLSDVTTLTVYKNGIATNVTFQIVPGQLGAINQFVLLPFADSDQIDVKATSAGNAGVLDISLSVSFL